MLRLLLSLAVLLIASSPAHARRLALSFDDGWQARSQPRAAAWNDSLLATLADAHLTAILFAQGERVEGATGLALVEAWGRAGHAIGNHTYRHRSLGSPRMRLEDFTEDVLRNDSLLHSMPGWTRRLRFPYLKEGETAAKRDGMRRWMRRHRYAPGAVSIDASDWYYDRRYREWQAQHPSGDATRIVEAYLEHLISRAAYYDSLSQVLFGRSVDHVLLLHTNQLNAEFLPRVIARFRAQGWEFIAPEAAYRDPVYTEQPGTLPAGESLLWSIAKARGLQGLRYPAEDEIYEKPILDRILP